MTPEEYIKQELAEGRLTAKHVQALTLYYQAAHVTLGARDGMPGPRTRKQLEERYPALFPKPSDQPSVGKFLSSPLPLLPAHSSNPQARRAVITSGFKTRNPSRPTHNGVDYFYRWMDGDKPDFSGDGGGAGKNASGQPKWVVPYGVNAIAAAAGVVLFAGPTPTGFRVWVNHGNGLRTGYYHMESVAVKAGDSVEKGTALGRISHNPIDNDARHLHFEVSPVDKYEPLDPELYLL